MARHPIASVSGGQLQPLDEAGRPGAPIPLGSAAWFAWLAGAGNGSFAYRGPAGGFTARRERRGKRDYWYAYRTSGGRLHKAYLGAAEALGPAHLDAVARRLAQRHAPAPLAPVFPPAPEHLLAARLQIPPADPRLLPRPRLAALLDGSPPARLALVVAPAGYGKTSLVADWLARGPRPAGWLAVDPADNDAPRFWRYLLAAMEPLAPAERRPALAALRAAPPATPDALLSAALALLGPATGALVLDDYHLIEQPAIHRGVAFLLDNLPAGLLLVITARAEPPLPLARLRARGQLCEIDVAALRLSRAETAAFLNGVAGLGLSPAQLDELDRRADGWAAGLRLFALAAAHADPAAVLAGFGGGHRYVFDYLADEVLRLQPPATQQFLLRSSILDRLSAELCDALTQAGETPPSPSPGQQTLETLARAGLFLTPLDAEGRWYRMHPLFAEFLRIKLDQASPGLAPALHRRAAAWYARCGEPTPAIAHALAGADWAAAAAAIAAVAQELIVRGETATLRRWAGQLPPEHAHAHPEIGLYLAWALLLDGEVAPVEPWLRAVEERHGGGTSTERLAGELAAVRGALALLFGDVERAAALVERARAALPAESMFSSVITFFEGAVGELTGDPAAAAAGYAAAAAEARAAGNVVVAVLALCSLAFLRTAEGRLHEAEALHRAGLALAVTPDGRPLPPASMAHAGLAGLRYIWDDLDGVAAHTAACLEIGEAWREPDTLLSAFALRARLLAARGETAAAARLLDEALRAAPAVSAFGGREAVLAEQARLALESGQLATAAAWADAASPDIAALQPYHHGQYLLVARIRTAEGRHEEAGRWLASLVERAEADGRAGDLVEALVAETTLLLVRGQPLAAKGRLRRALELAAAERPIRTFLDARLPLAGLLRAVAREPGAAALRPYIAALLAADRHWGAPRDEAPPEGALVEPLSAREREVLALLAAGLSNRAIAERLVVEVGTVKRHLIAIYRKLDAHSRTEAVARARSLGLVLG